MHECTNARGALVHSCILALLHFGCVREGPSKPKPNILLITIDTFRADRLGTGVTPALDRLAASATQFTAARSAVPLTLPSHTTILTGLLPPAHGVRENGVDALSDTHKTIASALKPAGYQTAAFVGAFVLDRRFGLSQGFDTYDDRIPRDPSATERLEAERPASAVVDRALAWLDRTFPPSQPAQPVAPSPWFVWIHLYDPHAPYSPPKEFVREEQASRLRGDASASQASNEQRYEGELRYADAQVARVFEWLRRHQLTDRTLVVVAGDHGEGLGDHGEATHGMLLYDSTLHVPLIVSAPGAAPAVRKDAVSLTSIAPTILSAAGIAPPPEVKSTDLYSETEYPRVAGWSPLQALTDGRWKTIRIGGADEVYDLQNDPHEEHDVTPKQGGIASAMTTRIEAIRAAAKTTRSEVSSEAAERLRALGYVASSAQPRTGTRGPNPARMIQEWDAFENALSELTSNRAAKALPALKSIAISNPASPVFQTTYARALRETGDVKGALEVYRRAAKQWPTDALLLHDLAVAARDAAQRAQGSQAQALRDEAVRADQAALVIAPKSGTALNGLGLLAIDAGRPQDAVKSFEAAAAADPNNASYWTNVGNARRAMRDPSGAEQAYRQALDVDPRAGDAANGIGVLLVETGRPGDAVQWFERAIAAAPDSAEAHLNLGIALQQSGQPARAADQYRRVLAMKTPSREKDAAAKLLAALGAR